MDLVFLAAGNSTRFGSNKLLHKLNGKYMYRYGLEVMAALQQEHLIENIVLVTQYEEIVQEVEKCFPGIAIVRNPHPEHGISGSIRLGVEKVMEICRDCGKTCDDGNVPRPSTEKPDGIRPEKSGAIKDKTNDYEKKCEKKAGCMFTVADQPYVTEESLRNMILCWKNSDKGIVTAAHGDRMGNPVIFSERYYEELKGLEGDVGGKQVLKKHLDDVQMFEMPEPELKDLDSPTEIRE